MIKPQLSSPDVRQTVECPMPSTRRRRGWMLWLLWGMLGTALTLEGNLRGTMLTVAWILGGPFWILFMLWPFLWLRDRLRARRLWAAEVIDVTHRTPDAAEDEAVTLPVVFGRTGVLVPVAEWRAVFPETEPGIAPVPAGTHAGVGLDAYGAEELIAWSQSHVSGGEDDKPAHRWCDTLRRALA